MATTMKKKKKKQRGASGSDRARRRQQDRQEVEQMDVSDIEVIDLCTPVSAVALLPAAAVAAATALSVTVATSNFAQLSLTPPAVVAAVACNSDSIHSTAAYQSRTLPPNSRRLLILPAFPTPITSDHCPDLLLANVPGKTRWRTEIEWRALLCMFLTRRVGAGAGRSRHSRSLDMW